MKSLEIISYAEMNEQSRKNEKIIIIKIGENRKSIKNKKSKISIKIEKKIGAK